MLEFKASLFPRYLTSPGSKLLLPLLYPPNPNPTHLSVVCLLPCYLIVLFVGVVLLSPHLSLLLFRLSARILLLVQLCAL